MRRLHSQLIGRPLTVKDTGERLGRVFDLVMDPDRGTLMGVKTTHARVIAPCDLGVFSDEVWEVKDSDAPIDEQDLVRLEAIPRARRKLIGKPVVTEQGHGLGRVDDFMLEMNTLSLIELVVTKRVGLLWAREHYLIGRNQIVAVTDEAVIVKDQHIKEAEPVEDVSKIKKSLGAPVAP